MNKYKILKEYRNNLTILMDILGSGSTNNEDLEKIGTYLFGGVFKGVYASDQMPLLKNKEMCIINTDDSKGSGVHWIACYKYRNRTYVYDSFDRDVKSLSEHWKKKHNWINANSDRDQSYTEANCGSRAISWLISVQKYKPNKIKNII